MVECHHVKKYKQAIESSIYQPFNWKCFDCDSTDSVMACLSCMFVGCDSFTGPDHAYGHFRASKHGLFMNISERQLYCFDCGNYVLNDNLSGDILMIRNNLSSLTSGSETGKFCKTRKRIIPQTKSEPKEDIFTTSIWHRRLRLLNRAFSIWRLHLYEVLGCDSSRFAVNIRKRGRGIAKKSENENEVTISTQETATEHNEKAPFLVSSCKRRGRKRKGSKGRCTKSRKCMISNTLTINENNEMECSKNELIDNAENVNPETMENSCSAKKVSKNIKRPKLGNSTSAALRCKAKGSTGLVNLGNTCYMNSIIQVLGHLDGFCDAICSMSLEPPVVLPSNVSYSGRIRNPVSGLNGGASNACIVNEDSAAQLTICRELHAIFNIIWSGKCPLYSPTGLQQAIWHLIPSFRGHDQHDAQEFLTVLLDTVHREMKNCYGYASSVVQQCFEGCLSSQIWCNSCLKSKCSTEMFWDLSLEFPDSVLNNNIEGDTDDHNSSCSLEKMLEQFTRWEELDSKYCCNSCKSSQKAQTKSAVKRLMIEKLPRILRFHLKRFCWSSRLTSYQSCKINTNVIFGEYLDVRNFLSETFSIRPDIDDNCIYKLSSVVVHDGQSFDRGHYKTYCHHDLENVWLRFDDKDVRVVTLDEVLGCEAYILFYKRDYKNSLKRPFVQISRFETAENPEVDSLFDKLEIQQLLDVLLIRVSNLLN